MTVKAVSYGGGVQSTALLVLAAEERIDFPVFLFANVGDDSEHPATLRYVRDVAVPYAERHGIEVAELRKRRRDGSDDTLMQRIERGTTTVPIPMRRNGNGAPGNRTCTAEFKIRVVAAELRRRGATKSNPAHVALGISVDEYHRARTDSGIPHERLIYPLIDLRMDRQDCISVIERAGLPVPPKSSCYFCPFHTIETWRGMLRNEPELFAKSVELERMMNARRVALGRDPVWLTRALKPLDEAVTENGQQRLFDEEGCAAAGYCHV